MSAGETPVTRTAPDRCAACGAPHDARVPPLPVPPAPEHAAPAGTHCEWCGAEFPDAD